MKLLRPTSFVLLLAFAGSGLQVCCAPVAADAPIMPCHVANPCGDESLQAGCCCLSEASSASLQFVVIAEPPSVSMSAVGMAAATFLPLRSSALGVLPSRVPQPHPRLFQLYCSFLI